LKKRQGFAVPLLNKFVDNTDKGPPGRRGRNMSKSFFADYKKYIVIPDEEKKVGKKAFDPREFAGHYILTLTIYQPVIKTWAQAEKFNIDPQKSIEKVLEDFNQKHHDLYHLELLELEDQQLYFVVAFSCREKIEEDKTEGLISHIVERLLTNPFYIAQSWYNLTSERGRVERKLFCYSYRVYTYDEEVED
jgi:hypothetical protein